MIMKPLGDHVAIEREAAKEFTPGGIALPDVAKDRPQRGKVLAVGDGRVNGDGSRSPLQVKAGDVVLFKAYAGEEFKLGENKVLLVKEDDVMAVIG
jgi:chaperonin GroES